MNAEQAQSLKSNNQKLPFALLTGQQP